MFPQFGWAWFGYIYRPLSVCFWQDFKKGFRQPPWPFALDLRSATPRRPGVAIYFAWVTSIETFQCTETLMKCRLCSGSVSLFAREAGSNRMKQVVTGTWSLMHSADPCRHVPGDRTPKARWFGWLLARLTRLASRTCRFDWFRFACFFNLFQVIPRASCEIEACLQEYLPFSSFSCPLIEEPFPCSCSLLRFLWFSFTWLGLNRPDVFE